MLVSAVIGGRVTAGIVLWLRCRLRCRTWGKLGVVEDGRGGISREGEPWLETSSAFPSKDIDRRTLDWLWVKEERSEVHEDGGKWSYLLRSVMVIE